MRAFVRFRLPDGSSRELGHGDLIGRLRSAALHLDDPRVSEAHAMVSLRGETLRLLALRGRFAIAGRPQAEVDLVAGLQIQLARDVELTVEAVVLPPYVMAVEGDGLPRLVLNGVSSLITQPRPALVPGFRGEAAAWIWSGSDGWSVRVGAEEARPMEPGDRFEVDGREFRAVAVEIQAAEQGATRLRGGVSSPVRIVARYDTVHIRRRGEPVVVLTGIAGRILSELASCGVPVNWDTLAREVWPDETDGAQRRRKWDVSLARLRKKLRDCRIRADLIGADGTGNFELVLQELDVIVDET